MKKLARTALVVALLLESACATAPVQDELNAAHLPDGVFVTLGTAGGPVAVAERSQPANLFVAAGKRYLVDAGDGAAERLAALGLQPGQLDGVFITHLHMDHIAGLQGVIGLRWMTRTRAPLSIYGPPGTQELVAGLVRSMEPSARIGLGFGDVDAPPERSVVVVELQSGADVDLGGLRVRTARNSHFSTTAGPDAPLSLSYRFDLAERSIGFTGDTGPSEDVERLFQGVDLLVSEVSDVEAVIADARRQMPQFPEEAWAAFSSHIREHHLTPEAAGALARRAGARRLVFTHLGIVGPNAQAASALIARAGTEFSNPIEVASDLDRF